MSTAPSFTFSLIAIFYSLSFYLLLSFTFSLLLSLSLSVKFESRKRVELALSRDPSAEMRRAEEARPSLTVGQVRSLEVQIGWM